MCVGVSCVGLGDTGRHRLLQKEAPASTEASYVEVAWFGRSGGLKNPGFAIAEGGSQHVTARDDADQLSVRNHRHADDALAIENLHNTLDGIGGVDRDDFARHNLVSERGFEISSRAQGSDKVELGDDTDEALLTVRDREPADTADDHVGCDLIGGGKLLGGDDVGLHEIPGLHGGGLFPGGSAAALLDEASRFVAEHQRPKTAASLLDAPAW